MLRRIGVNMNFPDTFTILAQISDEVPTVFPFPFHMHLILCVISIFFFGYRFAVQKRPYQLIFAIAVPLSLSIWLSNNRTFFYILGLVELILVAAAFVLSIAVKPKEETGKADGSERKSAAAASEELYDERSEEADDEDDDTESGESAQGEDDEDEED